MPRTAARSFPARVYRLLCSVTRGCIQRPLQGGGHAHPGRGKRQRSGPMGQVALERCYRQSSPVHRLHPRRGWGGAQPVNRGHLPVRSRKVCCSAASDCANPLEESRCCASSALESLLRLVRVIPSTMHGRTDFQSIFVCFVFEFRFRCVALH